MENTIKIPSVFISYSWDSQEHEEWVMNLANRLISDGVNVILDKFELRLGNDLLYFMENSVLSADKTVLVLTPNYKVKASNREGGVGYEYSIISGQVYKINKNNNRFIPLLKNGDSEISIPVFFETKLFIDFRNNQNFYHNYQILLRDFFNIPKYTKPPLGSIPKHITDQLEPKTKLVFNNQLKLIGRNTVQNDLKKIIFSAYQIIIIEGIGGIGKTALVDSLINDLDLHIAFKNLIWISAKSVNLSYSNVLDEIAYSLDYSYLSQLDLSEKIFQLNRILKNEKSLIIIDNFDTIKEDGQIDILNFLLGLHLNTKAIITSRPSHYKKQLLPNIFIFPLNGLADDDAVLLLKKTCFELNIAVDNDLLTIFEKLNLILKGNPLAIKLIVSELKYGSNSFEILYEKFKKGENNVFVLLFENLWCKLTNEAKNVLEIASLFYDGFTKNSLNDILNEYTFFSINSIFQELTFLSLIECNNAIYENDLRFDMHPLIRAFCESKISNKTVQTEKLVRYYTDFTETHTIRFWEGKEFYKPIDIERINIFNIIEWCKESGHESDFVTLVYNILDYMIVKGFWNNCQQFGRKAIEFAEKQDDLNIVGSLLLRSQGYIYTNIGKYDDAERSLKLALNYFKKSNNLTGVAEVYRNIGRNFRKYHKFDLATKSYNSALKLAKKIKNEKLKALTLNELGKLERDRSNNYLAIDYFEKAISAIDKLDSSIYAGILCNLSGVAISVNNIQLAEKTCVESLNYFIQIANLEGIASSKWRLAQIQLLNAEKENSLTTLNEALDIFLKLGIQDEIEIIEKFKKSNF